MANKKRIATSVAAVATAAALLLGGTFAWQSVNQTALNEASDVINPGGRLHDDFNGTNKDVYVENFTDPENGGEDIFARIRLEEYFEITMNKGAGEPIEKTEILVGGEDTDSEGNTVKTYDVFTAYETLEDGVVKAAVDDDGTAYWSWTTGGETVYMPTFNKDKDSLDADINGTYEGTTPSDDVHYDDYEEILDEKTADAVYDADADNLPDGEKVYVEETHYSANTLNATLISMAEWVNDYNSEPGEYWVYDTDGWVYWAQAIEPGTATGLLLDGIELNQVMDDSWYYAINVVAQFVTADDLGKTDGTGFYDTAKGSVPSAAALELLKAIGVETEGATMVNDAAALQDALDKGEDVTIGEVTATEANTEREEELGATYNILWHEGGTMNGGELTLGNAYFGLFINNEENWPVPGDSANKATINDTSITASDTNAAVYTQAIDAPIELNNVTIDAGSVGVWADLGSDTVTLNNCNITSHGDNTEKDWLNSAVAAVGNGKVVINSGTYTGENAVYVYSTGGTIEINGGTFNGELHEDAGELTIKGGTFDHDPAAFVAEGYEAIYDGESDTWTVQEEVFVDTIPPTVSVEKDSSFKQIFTVSNVTETDFPLTVKMYYLDSANADYESKTPAKTITITKTADGVEYVDSSPEDTVGILTGVTMTDGIVTVNYNLAPPEMCYLHAVVSDASGNEASANIKVPGATGCFVAGTQVQTVDGLVNIKDIKVGDQVYSIDLSTGEKVVSTVAWVQGTRYIDATYTIYAGGETVEATYEHPFYVIDKEWVAAEDLTVGDVIKTMDGEAVITDIVYTELDAPVQVYNFTVEGTHNYLITAAGLLVHNVQK